MPPAPRRAPFLALLLFLPLLACRDIERPSGLDALLSSQIGFWNGASGSVGVISTDFAQAGRFSLLTEDGISLPGYVPVHSDAVARYHNGYVYVLNRLNRDNVQVYATGLGFQLVAELPLPAGSNPHDIAITTDGKVYVALYGDSRLAVAAPGAASPVPSLELGAYAEGTPAPDGLPEATALWLEEDRLYVALQRLDRNHVSGHFLPTDSSLLIEISTITDTVSGVFSFRATNPFSRLHRVELFGDPHLVVTCPGRVGFVSELDGGVEAFNLRTRAFHPEFLYTETAAAGDILDVAVKSDTMGYALVLDAGLNKYVHRFNPTTGARTGEISFVATGLGNISGLLLTPRGRLYVADANFQSPGIRIYDTNNNDAPLYPGAISTGLRPFDLVHIPGR